MIVGLNTEIAHKGRTFHIQTEDRGGSPLLIETVIYEKGKVVASRKTRITERLTEEETLRLMRRQHQKVISEIVSGRFLFNHQEKFKEEPLSQATTSLDDLIINYLSLKMDVAGVNLRLLSLTLGENGEKLYLKVATTKRITGEPLSNIWLCFKLIRGEKRPEEVAFGLTDEQGIYEVQIPLPGGTSDISAIIIEADGREGRDRIIQPFLSEDNEKKQKP
jgi:hypothetical protein